MPEPLSNWQFTLRLCPYNMLEKSFFSTSSLCIDVELLQRPFLHTSSQALNQIRYNKTLERCRRICGGVLFVEAVGLEWRSGATNCYVLRKRDILYTMAIPSICPFVRPSVCLSVCVVCLSLCISHSWSASSRSNMSINSRRSSFLTYQTLQCYSDGDKYRWGMKKFTKFQPKRYKIL